MNKWVGKDNLVYFENGKFGMNFNVKAEEEEILHEIRDKFVRLRCNIILKEKSKETNIS